MICEVISHIAFSFRILGRHVAQIYSRIARNKDRRYLRDTVVKTFGRLYNEFLPTKRSIVQENGVQRAHEVPMRQGCAQGVGRAHHPRGALVSFPDCYLFFYFSKYSKTEKYCLKNCFGVGLLTVPHTYSFSESETFRKVSLMYSFGVTVSIILVSTFMGLPEI